MNIAPALAPAIIAFIALGIIAAAYIMLGMRHARRRAAHVEIVFGDITEQRADVIVNAAKRSLLGGGGVDGAIHKAGGPEILRECRALRAMEYPSGLPVGSAVATTAGDLSALWVVHTVGPMYNKWAEDMQAPELRSCYTESLRVADSLGAATVAFPLISSGVYGWPMGDAIRQALVAITTAKTDVHTVRLVLFDQDAFDMAKAAARLMKVR